MGIETSSTGGKKGEEIVELAKGKATGPSPNPNSTATANTNRRGKKSRRSHPKKAAASATPVQKLYDTCKEVFANGGPDVVPSPDKIEKLKAVLDNIQPTDVGLNPENAHFRLSMPRGTPPIKYLHMYEDDKFSMGIFCLPPSAVLPLHNHPGMTVFSKLLFGTLHIKSYDWVVDVPCNASNAANPSEVREPEVQQSEEKQPEIQDDAEVRQPQIQQSEVRLAKVKVDSNFTAPCETRILYPAEGGNMHCFTAVTASAVLDVLGPPYCDSQGRHCQYYLDYPFTDISVDGVSVPEEEKERYAWLKERDKPDDLVVRGERYGGPKILLK